MSQLGYYAKRCHETKGLEHQSCVWALRSYIMQTPIRDLISAIGIMNDQNMLRALWEAGLGAELQQIVLKRAEELAERRA